MSMWDDEHIRQILADADLGVTVRRWPHDDDEPCERCGLVEACMCGEPRHDVDPRDLT